MELSLDRVLGIIGAIGIIIGVGVAIAMDPKVKGEALFASGCFILSGISLCLTVGVWAFGTTLPTVSRIVITGVLCGCVCIATVEAIRWSNGRYQRAVSAEKKPVTPVVQAHPEVHPLDKPHSRASTDKTGPRASLEMELKPAIDVTAVRLYVDLNVVNVGQMAARKFVRLHRGMISKGMRSKEEVDEKWEEFERANKTEPLGTNDMGIRQKGSWRYEYSDFKLTRPLTVDILKDIDEGRSVLYVFVALKYKDDLHPLLESTACIAYTKGTAVTCSGHNTVPL